MKPKSPRVASFAAAFSLVAFSSAIQAATYNWSGANNGFWDTDTNWSGSLVPTLADDLTILGPLNVAGALNIDFNANNSAKSIAFTNTAATTITNTTSGADRLLTLGSGGITTGAGLVTIGSSTANQGVNIALASNQTWNVGAGGLTMNSIISGTGFSLTKSGAGTLTLSRANTYSGGTAISAGVVAISNATALGSGSVSITGSSRINAAALTYANSISIASSQILSLQNTGAANSTATFSGAITGAGGVTLVQGANSGTTIALSNANNTFTGNLTLPTGTGANDFISFGSIGDGGSIVYGRQSWRSVASYTGAAALNLGTRSISLASTFGGLGTTPGLDGGGSPINMFGNSGSGVVTINSAMSVASSTNNGIFYFGGSNTGNNTFSGAIADNPGTGTLGIGKWDAGKWILSNSTNSFNGNVYIGNGTLSVPHLQALGNGSIIQLSLGNSAGILEFTGSTDSSTTKQIVIGNLANNAQTGGGTILNNGTGTLSFTNATFNSLTVPWTASLVVTTVDRTLTLGGTYSGSGFNQIQGTIQDNVAGAAQVLVTVAGSKWLLTGTNTYTGATTINNGSLVLGSGGNLNGSSTIGTAVTVASGGTLAVRQTASATSNAIGQVGQTTASSLALNSGSAFTMADTFTSTLNLTGTATLAPASGTAPVLTFDIVGANRDVLAISGAATVGAATARIAISPTSTPTAGSSYTVITAASGLNTNFALANSLLPTANGLMSLAFTGSSGTAQVVEVSDAANALYWSGATDVDWNTAGNWNTSVAGGVVSGSAPTTSTDVAFGTTTPVAANLSNSLSAPLSVNSLNFLPGSGAYMIGGSNGITVATNINDNSGANQTISAPLTVTGNLNKTAGGTLTLAGSNTISGRVSLDAGTLRLENGNAITATSGITGNTVSALNPANGTTIQLRANADTTFNSGLISLPQGTLNIDVNNIDGSTTGRTLTLGTASFSNGGVNASMLASNGTGSFGATTLNITGGNSYGLALGNIQQVASAVGSTFTVNAGTIPVSINQFQTASFGSNFIVNSGMVTLGSLSQNSGSTNTLTVNAGGTLVLNGATAFHNGRTTGGNLSTVLNASGTLVVNNAGALANSGTGNLNVPTLIINGGTLNSTQSGGVTVTAGGITSPTMQWNGDFAFTGTENLNLGNGAVTMTTGTRTVTVNAKTLTVGGSIVGGDLAKAGTGTLALTGLSAIGSANYSGATIIGNGTLALTHASTASLLGTLTFGSAAGATDVGTLDLTAASASFGGLSVRTNSASSNLITVGAGKTLTLTGSSVANVVTVGASASSSVAKLQIAGATPGDGTFTVDDATRNIVVATTLGDTTSEGQTLDLSGLGTFNATVANVFVGRPTGAGGAASTGKVSGDSLILAGANTINASGVIVVGATSSSGNGSTVSASMTLGTTNNLNAARIVVGASRVSGTVQFNTGLTSPSAVLRGASGGTSRTDIYLGDGANILAYATTNGGSTTSTGTMNFTGGTLDARIGSLFVGYGANDNGSSAYGAGNGVFTFGGASSVVDINTLVIGETKGNTFVAPAKTTSAGTFTMNGGGADHQYRDDARQRPG